MQSLSSWTREAESLETAKNLLYFKQLVGLKFNKERLASLERQTKAHYTRYLQSYPSKRRVRGEAGWGRGNDDDHHDDDNDDEDCGGLTARGTEGEAELHRTSENGKGGRHRGGLFIMSIGAVGAAVTYRQLLKLYEARTLKVVSREFKFGGAPVNWGSWRQFAASTNDSAARKRLFDDFLVKSSVLAPLIRSRFETYKRLLSRFRTDPLSIYLQHEGIGYERLASMVGRLGELARGPFSESLAHYSEEVLGRPAEYYDDYYFFKNQVFKKYATGFQTKSMPITSISMTMKRMGLDASRIAVDDIDRKGKSASAFCSAIRVPTDVRISYRKANPLEDFASVFHEFGHGIHFSSIDPGASFFDRYGVANGVAEVFSIFFEGLIHERAYLRAELGLPGRVAEDVLGRFRFNVLFFAAFYAANSTLKLRYWHDYDDYATDDGDGVDDDNDNGSCFERLDDLYSDLTERFMGIRYPGAYWKLHHVMPDYFLYSPSYLIAAVRAAELRDSLVSRFGETYWRERGSGRALLELMRPGQALDLSFSRLDEAAYVRSLSSTQEEKSSAG
jgi:hypothetical protein